MSCKHPRQPDPNRYGQVLLCAWPRCTPVDRYAYTPPLPNVGYLRNDQVVLPQSLYMLTRQPPTGAFTLHGMRAVAHAEDCPLERVRAARGTAVLISLEEHDDACACDAGRYWWAWGDEAEQALCGETFDMAGRVKQLEGKLVDHDRAEAAARVELQEYERRAVRANTVGELMHYLQHTPRCAMRRRSPEACDCGLMSRVRDSAAAPVAPWDFLGLPLGGTRRFELRGPALPNPPLSLNDVLRAAGRPTLGEEMATRVLRGHEIRESWIDEAVAAAGGAEELPPVTASVIIGVDPGAPGGDRTVVARQDHPHAHETRAPGSVRPLVLRDNLQTFDDQTARIAAILTARNPLLHQPPGLDVMEVALGERDVAFVDGWTVRRCVDCRRPIAGGPTRCSSCVELEVLRLHEESAELGARESLLRGPAELEAGDSEPDGDADEGAD